MQREFLELIILIWKYTTRERNWKIATSNNFFQYFRKKLTSCPKNLSFKETSNLLRTSYKKNIHKKNIQKSLFYQNVIDGH